MTTNFTTQGLFPWPIYIAQGSLDSTDEKDIDDLIGEGVYLNGTGDVHTKDTYIFDTRLNNLKEFCEQHIKNYVKEMLQPQEEVGMYITQSWINVVSPFGNIKPHWHSNSIISGAFYVATEESDKITFVDPNLRLRYQMYAQQKEFNIWNSPNRSIPAKTNQLILFPSMLEHRVDSNIRANKGRISISFNTFAKHLGKNDGLNELVLANEEDFSSSF